MLAGEEGFEPPHPVLETGGLPLNLLPFKPMTVSSPGARESPALVYFTSRWAVWRRHDLQNFFVSSRSLCFLRFLDVV
jgi:hypothetical protein